jgi:hypothetical protein
MIQFLKIKLDCINKFNTMFCLIQIKDVKIELHFTCLRTKGIHLSIGSWYLIIKTSITLFWNYSTIKKKTSKPILPYIVFLVFWRFFLKVVSQIRIEWFFIWCFYLLFTANLLKVENEANVKCFLHIIELEADNFHENQPTINNNIAKDQTHQ